MEASGFPVFGLLFGGLGWLCDKNLAPVALAVTGHHVKVPAGKPACIIKVRGVTLGATIQVEARSRYV